MATAIVSIMCIVLIVLGGMTMSQGILTSADKAALGVDKISATEGTILRTKVHTLRATHLSWADLLRVTVDNCGQTKLANFDKWDFIVHYYDSSDGYHAKLGKDDGDMLLSANEKYQVTIGNSDNGTNGGNLINALAPNYLGINTTFTLEVVGPAGAVLTIERTTPAYIDTIMNLN